MQTRCRMHEKKNKIKNFVAARTVATAARARALKPAQLTVCVCVCVGGPSRSMNFFSSGPNLEKQVFDLKLTSKQFDRMSAKSTKQEKAELLKARPSWRLRSPTR